MLPDGMIKNSIELEFVIFCIKNIAAKLGVGAELVYKAFTEKSDILRGYIVPEYEVLHTQDRDYILNDLLDVMKERGGWRYDSLPWLLSGNFGAGFAAFTS